MRKVVSEEEREVVRRRELKVLDALDVTVAVLDSSGTILMTNRAWHQFARSNPLSTGELARRIDVGTNYLEVCRESRGASADNALRVVEGIEAVIRGRKRRFTIEYPCHAPSRRRWFRMQVSPVPETRPREVLVVHTDITSQKIAEEALLQRQARLQGTVGRLRAVAEDLHRSLPALGSDMNRSELAGHAGNPPSSIVAVPRLSARERQMLSAIVRGERNAEIAQRTGLSKQTVSTYRFRLFEKLGVASDAQLAVKAGSLGLLDH